MTDSASKDISKLLAITLLAIAGNVPTLGASAAEPPARATCSAPDHFATLKTAYVPDYPAMAKIQNAAGSTLVRVSLKSSGAFESATVAKSSGFAALDKEALLSTSRTTYDPETVACLPVGGNYLVEVTFAP